MKITTIENSRCTLNDCIINRFLEGDSDSGEEYGGPDYTSALAGLWKNSFQRL
jgi:hypothetical protein